MSRARTPVAEFLRSDTRFGLEDDELGLPLSHVAEVQGPLVIAEDVGRGREAAHAAAEADDPGRAIEDLSLLVQGKRLALVAESDSFAFIDDHAVHGPDAILPAADHFPGQIEPGVRVQADDLDVLLPAIGELPASELDDEPLAPVDAGRGDGLVVTAVEHDVAEVEVAGALLHDPDVGPGVIDDAAGVLHGPDHQAELQRHQDNGEDDAHQGHDEFDFVVEKVASCDGRHS